VSTFTRTFKRTFKQLLVRTSVLASLLPLLFAPLLFAPLLVAPLLYTPQASAAPLNDPSGAQHIERLFELIEARLELMRGVAAYKFSNQLAIEDQARETIVLDDAAGAALAYGLTPASSRFFFAIQIEAAKEIQRYWFEEWADNRQLPESIPSLQDELRPRLNELGEAIVSTIADTYPITDKSLANQFVRSVNIEGLSDSTKYALFRALFEVEKFPNRLDQIVATGVLRVATTGDYAPFSTVRDDLPAGIDIRLAGDLARSLGVDIRWVKTSWPTLLDDLRAGSFDIAMSGISRTLARQQVGFLSQPYHVGGKTPISRCDQTSKYTSLTDIDQPGVRVIVNPGGTNEDFARTQLHQASLISHGDNRSIFAELVAGRADVMITDAIEVRLQTVREPDLCATMQGQPTLTYQEKAYLLPRDLTWREYVDTWLSLRMADGTVAAAFAAELLP
jgi:cyclohexadienyl dehydratase